MIRLPIWVTVAHWRHSDLKHVYARSPYTTHRPRAPALREQVRRRSDAEWMRQRGKLGGQNKVPRIITKLEMLKEVVDLARRGG